LSLRELGLKIVVMTIAIFFSFCLQLAFALLELIGGQDTCDSSVDSCDSCSAGLHNSVSMWLLHTPEFYFVVLLSIALSMLVLLWCVLFPSFLSSPKPSNTQILTLTQQRSRAGA
jgi:hypothetical protein